MSNFPMNPGMYAESTFDEAPRTSGLAIAALVCALLFCIPAIPLLGVILGLLAIVGMIGKPHLRGRGLAIAAIVLGLVFSSLQAAGGWWAYQISRSFVVLFRDSPAETMRAGYDGNYAAFRTHLRGSAAMQSDEEIRAFIDSVRGRWGEFASIAMNPNQQQRAAPPTGGTASVVDIEYMATFSSGAVPAVIEFRFEPVQAASTGTGGSSGFIEMGISAITFRDRDRGDIRFPILPKAPQSAEEAAKPAEEAAKPAAGESEPGSAGR